MFQDIKTFIISQVLFLLRIFGIGDLDIADINQNSSPVIHDGLSDQDTFTLDRIIAHFNENTFCVEASSSCDNRAWNADDLPVEVIHDIFEFLQDNQDSLRQYAQAPEEKDTSNLKYLSRKISALNTVAYETLLKLMREMNILFPGKAVRIDPESPVGAVNYFKHGCCPCNIITVAMNDKNTDLVYEVSNYEGDNEECDDDDLGFENRGYLLEAVMRCIEEPSFGEYDDEETFIVEGTDPDSIPGTDPEKTPLLHRLNLIKQLKENLKKKSHV